MNSEQGTGSREQGAGNREQGIGNRKKCRISIHHFSLFIFLCSLLLAPCSLYSQTATNAVLSLNDTLNTMDSLEFRWDPFFGSGVIRSGEHFAAFFAGSRAGETGPVLFDNREMLNLPLPYEENNELRFPQAFVQAVNTTFMRFEEDDLFRFNIAAIVIDPGHGGKDPGAIATHTLRGTRQTINEKDIVLKVSLLLYERLSEAYPDKTIMLTRDADFFPSLEDRVLMANGIPLKDNEAIIYISVHANYASNPNAKGYEVWYLPADVNRTVINKSDFEGSPELVTIINDMLQEEYLFESRLLARNILNQFDEIFGSLMTSRGLKEESWYVVRNARMPSVLVELGFVSNETDVLLMTDETHLNRFAEVLYNGITEFVTTFEQSGGFTSIN